MCLLRRQAITWRTCHTPPHNCPLLNQSFSLYMCHRLHQDSSPPLPRWCNQSLSLHHCPQFTRSRCLRQWSLCNWKHREVPSHRPLHPVLCVLCTPSLNPRGGKRVRTLGENAVRGKPLPMPSAHPLKTDRRAGPGGLKPVVVTS